ncbi:arsenate reductase family protein [Mangrovivirga cuniculi]|nr:hypothetical protein [Mangrovivirga cuniculi]
MEKHSKEIKLITHHKKSFDKKAMGYAKLTPNAVQEVNLDETKLTPRMIKEIVDELGIEINDIVDRDSDLFKNEYEGVDLSKDDWLKVLSEKSELLKTPIVLSNNESFIVDTPSRLLEFREKYFKTETK